MKSFLALGFAVTALAACGPAPEPSRDAPGLAVEVADAPVRPVAGEATPAATTGAAQGAASVAATDLRPGSLCETREQTVWTCRAGARTISICASPDLNETEGYAQYRIGRPGALELEYPAGRVHPRGRFTYTLYPQGNQSLDFRNGGYDYRVFEDLRSPEDGVYVERDGQTISEITCNGGEGFEPLRTALGE